MIPDLERNWFRQKTTNGMDFGTLEIFYFFNFVSYLFIFIN